MSLFSKKSPLLPKKNLTKKRSLRMEPLEERQMLSVSPGFDQSHFAELQAAYPNLAANWLDYEAYAAEQPLHNIEIIPLSAIGEATDSELQNQLGAAMLAPNGNNLIVLAVEDSTDVSYNLGQTLTLTGGNATLSVIVWNLGTGSFQINTTGTDSHFDISGAEATVQFGGIGFTHLDADTGAPLAFAGGGFNIDGSTVNFENVTVAGALTNTMNVQSFEIQAVDATNSTVLTWDRVTPPAGETVTYQIQYRLSRTGSWGVSTTIESEYVTQGGTWTQAWGGTVGTITEDGNVVSTQITDLRPGTAYIFRVLPVFSGGTEGTAIATNAQRKTTAIGKPELDGAVSTTADSATFTVDIDVMVSAYNTSPGATYDPGANGNAEAIFGGKVQKQEDGEWVDVTEGVTITDVSVKDGRDNSQAKVQVTVAGLAAGTSFEFRVSVADTRTTAGFYGDPVHLPESPWSDAIPATTNAMVALDAPVVTLGDLGREIAGNDSWVEISWNAVPDAAGYEVHFFKGTDQNAGAGEWDSRGGPITFTKNNDGVWVGQGTGSPDNGWNNQMPILTESEGVLTMRCNTVFNGEKHEFYVIALATEGGSFMNSIASNHVVKGSQLAEPGVNVNPHNWFGSVPIETAISATSPAAGSLTVTYMNYDAWTQPWYLPNKPTGVSSVVEIATNDTFTAGFQTVDVANGTWDAAFNGLAGGTYYVRAKYVTDDPDFFDSNWSPTQTVTVVAGVTEPLSVPANTKVTDWTENTITVTWDAVEGAVGYLVQLRKSGEVNFDQGGGNWLSVSELIVGTTFTVENYKGTGAHAEGTPTTAPTEWSPLESGVQYRIQVKAIAADSQYNSNWTDNIGPEGTSGGTLYGTTRLNEPTLVVTSTANGFEVVLTDELNTAQTGSPARNVVSGYEVQWKLESESEWQTLTIADGKYAIEASTTVDIRARALTNVTASSLLNLEWAHSNWAMATGVVPEEELYEYAIALENPADATIDGSSLKIGDTVSVWYFLAAEDLDYAFGVEGVLEILPSVANGDYVQEGDGEWVDGNLRVELVFTLYQEGVNTFTALYMAYDDDYVLITPVTVIGTCETVTITGVRSGEEEPDNPSVIVTTFLDIVDANDGLISLREAIMYAQPGETITFASSLDGETIVLDGNELYIDKNITIDAEGMSITIDADQNSRAFRVASGRNVTFVGLAIENGQANDGGGAIYVSSGAVVSVMQSSFEGNSVANDTSGAQSFGGGAIYVDYGSLTVSQSSFNGNTVTNSAANPRYFGGGAIYLAGGSLTVSESSFDGNSVATGGDNSRDSGGGAIYLLNGTLTVSRTSFETNRATSTGTLALSGGGVYQNLGTFVTDNSLFAGNTAGQGGAVFTGGNATAASPVITTRIINATVVNNSGYAIHNNSNVQSADPPTYNREIYNTVFSGNSGNQDVFWNAIGNEAGTRVIANTIRSAGTNNVADGSFVVSDATLAGFNEVANPNLFNYRPAHPSAAINRITNPEQYLPGALTGKDLAGNARVIDRMDVGAFEFAESYDYRAVADTDDAAFIIDVAVTQPTFVEDGADSYWAFTLDVLRNDIIPADGEVINLEIVSGNNGEFIVNEDMTITYKWQNFVYDAPLAFSYKILGKGQDTWSNVAQASVSITFTSTVAPLIVNTDADDDYEAYDPQSGLLSLRQALYISDLEYADETTTIFFDPTTMLGKTIELVGKRLDIFSDVVIVGLGVDYLEIDAGGDKQLIGVRRGTLEDFLENGSNYATIAKTVTINDIKMSHGYTVSSGSINLNPMTTLILNGVNINNCEANKGGAIYGNGAEIVISNSVFENNYAGTGGAIHLQGADGTLTIDGCSFISNESVKNGGAIYGDGVEIAISNSIFDNNSAYFGGAIYLQNGGALTIVGGSFDSNEVTKGGGAVYVQKGTADISGSTFTENTAEEGGAFYLYGGTAVVSDAQFTGNQSAKRGGAVFANGSGGEAGLSISDSTFSGNTANLGGAVAQNDGRSTVTINSCDFYDNGLAIDDQNAAFQGGAVYNRSGLLDVIDSFFSGNQAQDSGGAIFHHSSGYSTNVTGSVFENNEAINGGAIYAMNGTLDVSASFEHNEAAKLGGAIYITRVAESTINDSFFHDNSASSGGAVYHLGPGNLTIEGETTFDSNSATSGGGALYVKNVNTNTNGILDIGETAISSSIVFVNNTANEGGAIYLYGGVVHATGALFTDNQSVNRGGAIFTNGSGGEADLNISGCAFIGNTSGLGGAIAQNDSRSSTTITSSFFYNNGLAIDDQNAASQGGAIYNRSGRMDVIDSLFSGNQAQDKGGAFYHHSSGHATTISNSIFEENAATSGGALYLNIGLEVEILDTSFTDNVAEPKLGGAIAKSKNVDLIVKATDFEDKIFEAGFAKYLNDADLLFE